MKNIERSSRLACAAALMFMACGTAEPAADDDGASGTTETTGSVGATSGGSGGSSDA